MKKLTLVKQILYKEDKLDLDNDVDFFVLLSVKPEFVLNCINEAQIKEFLKSLNIKNLDYKKALVQVDPNLDLNKEIFLFYTVKEKNSILFRQTTLMEHEEYSDFLYLSNIEKIQLLENRLKDIVYNQPLQLLLYPLIDSGLKVFIDLDSEIFFLDSIVSNRLEIVSIEKSQIINLDLKKKEKNSLSKKIKKAFDDIHLVFYGKNLFSIEYKEGQIFNDLSIENILIDQLCLNKADIKIIKELMREQNPAKIEAIVEILRERISNFKMNIFNEVTIKKKRLKKKIL